MIFLDPYKFTSPSSTLFADISLNTAGEEPPSGWSEIWSAGNWQVIAETSPNGTKAISVTSGSAVQRAATYNDFDSIHADVELLAPMKLVTATSQSSVGIGLGARLSGGSGSKEGYVVGIQTSTNQLQLSKYVANTQTIISSSSFTVTADMWFWIRFRVVGTALKARIWNDGSSEPGTWDIDTTDSSISAAGKQGFFAHRHSNAGKTGGLYLATNGDTA